MTTIYSKALTRDRNSLLKVHGGYLAVTIGAGYRVATLDGFYSIADKDGNEIGAISLEALSDSKIATARDAAKRTRQTYVAPVTVDLRRRETDTKAERLAGIALPIFGNWDTHISQTEERYVSFGEGAVHLSVYVGGYESTYRNNLSGVAGMTPTGAKERKAMQKRGAELKAADLLAQTVKAQIEVLAFYSPKEQKAYLDTIVAQAVALSETLAK